MRTGPKNLAVIGAHVAHSRSPLIHNYWGRTHHIDMDYGIRTMAADIKDTDFAQAFTALFQNDNALWGANITVPHKARAFQALQAQDAYFDKAAQDLGVVNVVYRNDNRLCGSNTDGAGFMAALPPLRQDYNTMAVVILGAGGATRAIIMALIEAGVADIRLCNRTRANAERLCADLGGLQNKVRIYDWQNKAEAAQGAHLLVNSSFLGMVGNPPFPPEDIESLLAGLEKDAGVCDIVYTPLQTDLLKAAEQQGFIAIDGLGMLLHQAALSFALWFGKHPEVTQELRHLLIEDLQK